MAVSGPDSDLAVELAMRWLGVLKSRSWEDRLGLLNEIHDHLREVIPEFDRFCRVFPQFISELVDRLDDLEIRSAAQAHVFANSGDPRHRKAAGDWLAVHQRLRR